MDEKRENKETRWSFHEEQDFNQPNLKPVSWTASEFIAHHKSTGWYALLALCAGLVAAAVYFLTKDEISTAMVALVSVGLAIFGARKPRVLNFQVDESGVTIGKNFYGYEQFRSFSIIDEDAVNSIYLTPLKRFMPGLTIYYAAKDEQRIIETISTFLPHEERTPDFIDNLMRKIRF